MRYEIIKWENEKAMLIKRSNVALFVKTKEKINKIDFKKLEFKNAEIANTSGILVFGDEIILEIIGEYINSTKKNLFDSLTDLENAFQKKTKDLLKFRGDLAEAIFINKLGGKKIYDGASVDIDLNGEMVEIKSFSPQKKTIHVSLQQIQENTIKFAVEILFDTNGKTIIQIANNLKSNPDFKNYLIKEYSNTMFEHLKYKVSDPINVNKHMPKVTFDKRIINATFEILIN